MKLTVKETKTGKPQSVSGSIARCDTVKLENGQELFRFRWSNSAQNWRTGSQCLDVGIGAEPLNVGDVVEF